jgi:hypothetical protein
VAFADTPAFTLLCRMWIANQLRELVQVRTFGAGSVVRLPMRFA